MEQQRDRPKTDELFTLADRLRALRERKDECDAALKGVNAEIDATEYALTNAMAVAECPNFTRNGKQFIMTTTKRWSAETDRKEDLYAALREQGYGHLFSVNVNTLGSFVKEMAAEYAVEHDGDEGLPDWLIGLVKSYDNIGITMKNAAKKS